MRINNEVNLNNILNFQKKLKKGFGAHHTTKVEKVRYNKKNMYVLIINMSLNDYMMNKLFNMVKEKIDAYKPKPIQKRKRNFKF